MRIYTLSVVPANGSGFEGLSAPSRKILRFKFQTATTSRSRAAARVGLLVDLPFLRGDGTPKGAPW